MSEQPPAESTQGIPCASQAQVMRTATVNDVYYERNLCEGADVQDERFLDAE